ncbi:MAG: molybdenum cofactor guanylyltransferase [Alphaproteobacteria bacterium]|nr:molybdenum cofactor guanylyltransferase [Alphaproteobacteria bacterium]
MSHAFLTNSVTSVILAGGLGKRLGGNKPHRILNDMPLYQWAYNYCQAHTQEVFFSLKPHQFYQENFKNCHAGIIYDVSDHIDGPISGIVSSLIWIKKNRPLYEYIFTIPVDMPFLDPNLFKILCSNQINYPAKPLYVTENNSSHYTIALWPITLATNILYHVQNKNLYRLQDLMNFYHAEKIDFSEKGSEKFSNINNFIDLQKAHDTLKENNQLQGRNQKVGYAEQS